MIRKKVRAENLEPLKINKTEANYQYLLLEMMTKLVEQQRESNRLLQKIAGETENSNAYSKMTIFTSPRKNITDSILREAVHRDHSFERSHDSPDIKDRFSAHLQQGIASSLLSPNNPSVFRQKTNQPAEYPHNQIMDKMNRIEMLLKRVDNNMARKENYQTTIEKVQGEPKQGKQVKEPQRPRVSQQMQSSIGFPLSCAHKEQREGEQFSFFNKENPSKRVIDIKFSRPKSGAKESRSQNRKGTTLFAQSEVLQKILQMTKADEKSSERLSKQTEQKKNYSILSQILPYSDRREIKIKFPVEDMLQYYKAKGEQIEVSKITQEWLGMVYRATASICWNMLSNNLLSFDETKILFTENIIFNFIEFMKTVKSAGYQNYRMMLVEKINLTSVSILGFLCTQYPQTKVQDPNIALRSEIPSIDNKGRAKFDIIGRVCRDKVAIFRKKANGDYTSEIMRVINYMIEKTNQEYNDFYNMMSELFGEVFLPIHKRSVKQKTEETYEDQMYFEKVKTYTKFLIGRKINKNTPLYADPEIDNSVFFVKSPSVLRIITKWVEELDQMIRKPDIEIKNATKEFKDHQGLPIHLYAQVKNALFKKIKENQGKFYEKVKLIKRECYNMEVLLTYQRFTTDPSQIHLSEEQISVGKYCTYLKSAISSYICSQLNELIDFLLDIPLQVDQNKIGTDLLFQEQCRKDLDSLNLVNCKIFDLLRCKCISKESEIVYLLKRLKDKSNDSSDPFNIIRVKDRLNSGTRDILINAQVGNGLVCEIQLAVTSNIDKKQELLDQYNHFLYELKRAKLGAITENASIWSALEQRATFFESQIKKDATSCSGQGPHLCITDFKRSESKKVSKFLRPIICASCQNFFEIPKTCLSNIKCEQCSETYCGQCHLSHLKPEDRKQYVFEKNFFKNLFPYLTQFNDFSKPLPRFGLLIRKKYLKKQLFFYRVLTKKSQNNDTNAAEVNIELVVSGIQKAEIVNKIINKSIIEANEINGEIFLLPSAKEEFEGYLLYGVKVQHKLQMVTLPYKQLLSNFKQSKFKYINIMKSPAYIDDLRILKKPKLILREMSSFKDTLNEDTLITYLKIYKTVFIVQINVEEAVLHAELIKVINMHRLKTYALEKCNSVSMEFRGVTDEMSLIMTKFPSDLMASFAKRLTKLYLNFGMVENVRFLSFLPNVKVLFIRGNKVTSLEGVENLKQLILICFDNNFVPSLEPLANLTDLTQISGACNNVESLNGIQNLVKLKKINLYSNNIKKMEHFQNLLSVKELSLSNNPIEVIQGIFHLKDLQDLSLGNTNIIDIEPLAVFSKIKKLALNGLNLGSIGNFFRNFDDLIKLNLSTNNIQSIQNMDEMCDLVELNLAKNRIKRIEGLASCTKLQAIKISQNYITDIAGIRTLQNLKVLKMLDNPLEDCSQFHLMNKKQLEIIFSGPGQASSPQQQPTPAFYDKYNAVLYNKNNSSGSNSSSEEDDQ